MTREMEHAKCMAVLCKLYRTGKITEAEFRYVKDRLKNRCMAVENSVGTSEKIFPGTFVHISGQKYNGSV